MSKKYSIQAKTCIKGESFFESLIAEYAIPHHIVGQKDIGVDYICEWAFDDEPSGILFAVQVKTFAVAKRNKPKPLGVTHPTLNALEAFSIRNRNLIISQDTLDYWKGLGLPAYLFVVAHTKANESSHPEMMAMYYKRFTYLMTTDKKEQGDEHFFQVNDRARFRAFADEQRRRKGFARDLFVDLMRWSYYKGSIAWLNPRKLGLEQFPEEAHVFKDLMQDYIPQICKTYAFAKPHLEELCNRVNDK